MERCRSSDSVVRSPRGRDDHCVAMAEDHARHAAFHPVRIPRRWAAISGQDPLVRAQLMSQRCRREKKGCVPWRATIAIAGASRAHPLWRRAKMGDTALSPQSDGGRLRPHVGFPARPARRATRRPSRIQPALARSVIKGCAWLALYCTWVLLLVGSLYAALSLGRHLGHLIATCLSMPGTPDAHFVGSLMGFSVWITAWLWHLMGTQCAADALSPEPDGATWSATWKDDS